MKKYIIAFALVLLFIIIGTSIMTSIKIETFQQNIGGLENPIAAPQTPNDLTAYNWLKNRKPGFVENLPPNLLYIIFSMRALTNNLITENNMQNITFRDAIVIPRIHYSLYDINIANNARKTTLDVHPGALQNIDPVTLEVTLKDESPRGLVIQADNLSNKEFVDLLKILESRLNSDYYVAKAKLEERRKKLIELKSIAETNKKNAENNLNNASKNYNAAVSSAENTLVKANLQTFSGNKDVDHVTIKSDFANHLANQLQAYQAQLDVFNSSNIISRCSAVWANSPNCNPTYGCHNFSTT